MRRSGTAHGRAEFHHRLIPHARGNTVPVRVVHPRLGMRGHICGFGFLHAGLTSDDPPDVPIDHRSGHFMRNRRHGSGRVGTDARKGLETRHHVVAGGRRRKDALPRSAWITDLHRERMQASTTCVVACALPEVHHLVKFRFGHRTNRREAVQKATPILEASRHLRLLKEHLGE